MGFRKFFTGRDTERGHAGRQKKRQEQFEGSLHLPEDFDAFFSAHETLTPPALSGGILRPHRLASREILQAGIFKARGRRPKRHGAIAGHFKEGGFELANLFSNGSTQAFLAVNPRVGIVTFRGTQMDDLNDIIVDLRTRFFSKRVTKKRHEKVHSGFNEAYEAVGNDLEEAINKLGDLPIYIT